MPLGADERRLFLGRFGSLEVYALDPYTIALSKLDRGFDTDLEDILFLLDLNLITLEQLEEVVAGALNQVSEFDMSAATIRTHLQTVRDMLA